MRALLLVAVLPFPLAGTAADADATAVVRCHGRPATIVGTAHDDHLVGTDGPDVIVGLGGADRIEGRGGDDVICGGANLGRGDRQLGGDDIDGGPGSDYVDPGRDRRRVGAQAYGDILRYSHAGEGVHVDLSSRLGTVVDGQDTDTIRVAEGIWVLGSPYDDVIVGSRFDDDLEGNKGADRLEGRRGDDGLDEYVGGLSRSDRDADHKLGGPGGDGIQANGGADLLEGGAGPDDLYENFGPPLTMIGGAGEDDLWMSYDGRPGWRLDGGYGIDVLEVDDADPYDPAGAQLIVDAGRREVRSSDAAQAPLPVSNVEHWRPTAEQPVLFLGTAGPDWLDARLVDRLSAQTFAGDDVVRGSYGPDTIDAGEGTDRIDGRGGRDTCVNGELVTSCELSP